MVKMITSCVLIALGAPFMLAGVWVRINDREEYKRDVGWGLLILIGGMLDIIGILLLYDSILYNF